MHSVQFSRSVVSDSLRPHELQHIRPPCPSPTPGVHSDSRPSSQWCPPTNSSSVVPFSSCPQSLPASESFSMSQLFTWGGQSTGVSALASFLPKKCQNGLVGSPCSPRDSQESSPAPQSKSNNFSALTFLYGPSLTSIHGCMSFDKWLSPSLSYCLLINYELVKGTRQGEGMSLKVLEATSWKHVQEVRTGTIPKLPIQG